MQIFSQETTTSNQQAINIQDNRARILSDLNRNVELPVDQFQILIESVKVNQSFLLLTLNPKGVYFQNLKRLIVLILCLLTLQFYQLLYLFTSDKEERDKSDDHQKFILRMHNGPEKEQKTVQQNIYFEKDIAQLLPIQMIRISYLIFIVLGIVLMKKMKHYYSNRNLLIFSLTSISATFAIQWYFCHQYPNYTKLHLLTNKHKESKIYLDNIIFLSIYILQGTFSASILYLIVQQAKFVIKKNQKDIFYNECAMYYSEMVIIAAGLHMLFKEQFIFNLLIMWIPYLLITIFVAIKVYDIPVAIIKRIRIQELISQRAQSRIKKQQLALNTITELLEELHENLTKIYKTNYPLKEYFQKAKIEILVNKFQKHSRNKVPSKPSINFIIFTLSLLYFGHIFRLQYFVNSLKWSLESLTLTIGIFELAGYFISNYWIIELYYEGLLSKFLKIFGIITFASAIPYFEQTANNQFQAQIMFCSILIIKLQFWLALKTFLIYFQDYKLHYQYIVLGLLCSLIMLLEIQLSYLLTAVILLIASQVIRI